MERQPAYYNYFFYGGYIELKNTIVSIFRKWKRNVSSIWDRLKDSGSELLDSLGEAFDDFKDMLSFEFEWYFLKDFFFFGINIVKFMFNLSLLVFVTVLTAFVSLMLTIIHVSILIVFFGLTYLFFGAVKFLDFAYCTIRIISTCCPRCQHKFSLPVYICPTCGVEHTKLIPSRYGILTRKCECGTKLPTTFFNGRQKLESICPNCQFSFGQTEEHFDLLVPVIGGPSSGKTCFINMSISKLSQIADSYDLDYKYESNGLDDYEENINDLNQGYLPPKTSDMRLRYYQFFLKNKNKKFQNLISVCDVGGEVFENDEQISEQIGFRFANAFIMVVDPLSIEGFCKEVSDEIDVVSYGGSQKSIDEVLNMLTKTLENMFNLNANTMMKTDVAVVFTKCDIPTLKEKIGENAINKYKAEGKYQNKYQATNALCEDFLKEYEEENFLNSLKSKFKSVQFFTCSALGHNANGQQFEPIGVEEPMLYLINKACPFIKIQKLGE